jgi:hypothetical protein
VTGNDSEKQAVNADKGEASLEVCDLNLDSRIKVADYNARPSVATSHNAGGRAHFNRPQ